MFKFRNLCIAISLAGCAVLAIAVWVVPKAATADDFRIESEVFQGNSRDPFAENLTLFQGGVVYDFMLGDSQEITVFDPQRSRMILLNPKTKLKTELKLEDIRRLIENQRNKIGDNKYELINPRLRTSYDDSSGWLTLASPTLTYRAKGIKPADSGIAKQYKKFADWNARLSSIRRGRPPFARLELNKALAEHQLLPERVDLTLVVNKRPLSKKIHLHSRHVIIWSLSQTDRERIERVGRYLATFESTNFLKFTGLNTAASQQQTNRR